MSLQDEGASDQKAKARPAAEPRKVTTERFDPKNPDHIIMKRPLIIQWGFP